MVDGFGGALEIVSAPPALSPYRRKNRKSGEQKGEKRKLIRKPFRQCMFSTPRATLEILLPTGI
jgi:hypothetical protein